MQAGDALAEVPPIVEREAGGENTHFYWWRKVSLYCQLDQMLQAHDGLKDARDLKDLIGWVGVAMNLKPEEVISKAGQHLNL